MMFGDLCLGLALMAHPFPSNQLHEMPSPGLFALEQKLHYQLSWDAAYPPSQHSRSYRDTRAAKLREVRAELLRREKDGELD